MSVSKEPLNIRNNNPGNLRFVGQEGASQGEGGFAKFETPQAGLDAMRNQIELDTQKRGLNLTQFLNKYAPPSENKTTNYIDFVARKTGLDPSSPIPASAIPQLQAAMIEMEGGPRSMSYFTGTAAQATPAQAPRTTVQRTGLPASYRFALAANYLGDTEKDSVTEKAMQLMEEVYGEPGGGAGAFKKKLQSILAPREKEAGAFDVLAKAQTEEAPKGKAVPKMPKMFADGGEVGEQYESLEDVMAAAPTQDAEQRQWEQEIPVRELTRQLNETVDRYRAGRASEADVKQFFPNYSDYDIANMFGMTDAGQSGPRPEITAQPFLTPEVYDRAMNRGRMEEYNVEREIREKSPNIYPNKRDFTLRLQQLADGGEVNYDQMAEQMTVGTLPTDQRPAGEVFRGIGQDIVRGAQYLPYDLAGAPVDIATMAMRPFGYNVEKPVGGSEYLIEKARQAGIAQAPTGSTAETATRIGMGFVNPAAVARQIPRGIAALEKGVEAMTLPTFRQITGNPSATKEQMMDFVLNQKSILQAGAPAISRSPGGTFFSSKDSNLNRLISRGEEVALNISREDPEKAAAAGEMFTKKAREFFEKRAGSINDELKKEMMAGRIKMPGELGEELFPKYLRAAAERGDVSAMRDLERRYDEMLSIKNINLPKIDVKDIYEESRQVNQNIKQNILAQFKQYPELIPDELLYKFTNKDPTEVRIRLKDNPEYFSTVLEPKIQKLINVETETIRPADISAYVSMYGKYAPENLSPNELEALKRGQPIFDIGSGYMDLFGYDIKDLARQTAKMSTQELKDINFATFVSRASKLAVKQKTLEARADELAVALKNNRPVDPKALSFGTEKFLELPDGFTWRKIVDPDATLIQGSVIDNSIGGYANYGSYGPFYNGRKALDDGSVELFVLYNKDGIPVTNVEMVKGEKSGKFSMRQAQGNGPLTSNVLPEDYLTQIKAFINKTQPEDLPFNLSSEIRYIDAPEGFAKGGMVDKPLYDRAV